MQIFISYIDRSRETVEALAADLTAAGHTVWFDPDLIGGAAWWAAVLDHVRQADVVLLALTPYWVNSQASVLEYKYAAALNKPIVPLALAPLTVDLLPYEVQEMVRLDYIQQNKAQKNALTKALKSLPPTPPLPNPQPEPPAVPLSPLLPLRDRIDAPILSPDEQASLLKELKTALPVAETNDDARVLLKRLYQRGDLIVRYADEIKSLLGGLNEFFASPPSLLPRLFTLRRLLIGLGLLLVLIVIGFLVWLRFRPTPPIREFAEQSGTVYSVAFSPDGKMVATGSDDNSTHLWDSATGERLQALSGHLNGTHSVAFSPDGLTLLTGGGDKQARLWEVATGQEIQRFSGHEATIYCVAFAPDGKTVATGSSDQTVRLWNVDTGKELQKFTGHTDTVLSVAFSPDGKSIVSGGSDSTIRLWDIATGKQSRQFIGHNAFVGGVAFSPTGAYILSSSGDKTALLWDASTGQIIQQYSGHTAALTGVVFSPDGKYVLTGSADNTARLWESATGQELQTFTIGNGSRVITVAFSPDGKYVLTGNSDARAYLWKVAE
ncbi:MAG: TIR domain-containing protein [Chloroflexota bacterium]